MNEQLLERLDQAALSESVLLLVLAAAMGEQHLADALGGERPTRPLPLTAEVVDPPQIYLDRIEVEGFRGVGPSATLKLTPGCGLTLVVGRNGSGKSSFAEAAELALTGKSQRWDGKAKVWQSGWANLHHRGARRIIVKLRSDGEKGLTAVESRWAADASLDDRLDSAISANGAKGPLSSLGLGPAFEIWRPFLSYDDLGSLLESTPSSVYDRLSALLGLENWTEVEGRLRNRAKSVADLQKLADGGAKSLRTILESIDDDRAVKALAALSPKGPWNLDEVEALATGTSALDRDIQRLNGLAGLIAPDPQQVADVVARLREAAAQVEAGAGTDSDQARSLSGLLQRAVVYHADHEDQTACPVCGTAGLLDETWRTEAIQKIADLDELAAQVNQANQDLESLLAEANRQLRPVPPVLIDPAEGVDVVQLLALWEDWVAQVAPSEGSTRTQHAKALADHLDSKSHALVAAVGEVVERAEGERERRQDEWRPIAEQLSTWLENAKPAQAGKAIGVELKAAADWVAAEAVAVREERFAPIADQVRAVWDQLRHDSSVSIDDLALDGTATRRRLELRVSVDDEEADGMSVLSQGELNALSLALHLPRATQDASPFRFVLIDDPVQALDAARVDGLARVLDNVATTRQVVVFTHDARLADACRRLAIANQVIEVSRGGRSALTLRSTAHPSERYLEDARAIAASDPFPVAARRRVVPLLCRQALEAISIDQGRRLLFERGMSFAQIEVRVGDLTTLFTHLAFGLFGDSTDKGVYERLGAVTPNWYGKDNRERLNAIDLVKKLNTGTHDGSEQDPYDLIAQTEAVVSAFRSID